MLGRLETLKNRVQDGVKELGAAAVNEARDALREARSILLAISKCYIPSNKSNDSEL